MTDKDYLLSSARGEERTTGGIDRPFPSLACVARLAPHMARRSSTSGAERKKGRRRSSLARPIPPSDDQPRTRSRWGAGRTTVRAPTRGDHRLHRSSLRVCARDSGSFWGCSSIRFSSLISRAFVGGFVPSMTQASAIKPGLRSHQF